MSLLYLKKSDDYEECGWFGGCEGFMPTICTLDDGDGMDILVVVAVVDNG